MKKISAFVITFVLLLNIGFAASSEGWNVHVTAGAPAGVNQIQYIVKTVYYCNSGYVSRTEHLTGANDRRIEVTSTSMEDFLITTTGSSGIKYITQYYGSNPWVYFTGVSSGSVFGVGTWNMNI